MVARHAREVNVTASSEGDLAWVFVRALEGMARRLE
jgi:hypothetical protein